MDVKMKVVSCKDEEEALDKASDAVRTMAHSLAMSKKSIILNGLVTPEDFDKALFREFDKEWGKIKDLDEKAYMMRVLGDMLNDGMNLGEIFGKDDN